MYPLFPEPSQYDWEFSLPTAEGDLAVLGEEQLKSIHTKDHHQRKYAAYADKPADKNAANFRHHWWKHRRELARNAMHESGIDPKTMHRFETCGENAFVYQSEKDPHKYRIQCDRCRSRWCEACQNERRLIIRRNLQEKLPQGRIRFLTLTVKSRTCLRTCVDHLQSSFKKLRARPYYSKAMRGGIWFLEVTRRKDNGEWHPHYHILYQGEYIPKEKLSLDWHKITKDSFIVDIRSLKNREAAPAYVTKYASKAIGKEIWGDHESLVTIMREFRDQKLLGTFGAWRGMKLCQVPESDEGWTFIAPLWKIALAAETGDSDAKKLLNRLTRYDSHANDHGNDEFDTFDTG